MGFLNRMKRREKRKKENPSKGNQVKKDNVPVSEILEENINTIKEKLNDCDDIIYRQFKLGKDQRQDLALIYTDGMTDKKLVSDFVMEGLMHEAREVKPEPENIKRNLYSLIRDGNIAVTEIKEVDSLNEVIDNVLIGETVLLIDKYEKIIVISSRGWPVRGIQEPVSETVVRGPRDGFTETGKINTSLIRRRIRDPKLKLKYMQIGARSKTDVAIMYIDDIVDKNLLNEVKKRLEKIEIDAILESSYIEQLIEDDHYSPFPQVESTERPDSVAASLYEGRVAIVVDNTPFVLIVPATLVTLLQSSEDYYDRWVIGTLIRIVRYLAIVVALLSPALYIALTSYHPGLLPTRLALYIAATRSGVPFPAFIEAFIMEITIEFLREAGTRLSGPIGTTIGIVGGLVIGQAAVEAGIVSPLMVIIVAVTTIASFMLPSYGFAAGFRVLRFALMAVAAALGLYGIMLGLIIIATHLVNLKTFGIPYMEPFATLGTTTSDLKDTFIRVPLHKMKKRPHFANIIDKDRLVDGYAREDGQNDRDGDKDDR